GRMLFGRNVAFAAALLFQVLPVPARITSDGLSEGLYLLTVAGALVLGVRAVRRPGVGGFLVCGLATGLGYLVRPEGLMVAGAVGLVAGWLGLVRKWPRDAAPGLALLGVFALRRRLTTDPGLCVLVALVGLNAAVLVGLGVTGYYVNGKHTGYVSERHTVLLVLVGCLFAAAALAPVPR